jgi:hypothetical protein
MVDTTLPAGVQAIAHHRAGVVHCVDRLFVFSGGANADNDTIEIAKIPPNCWIKDVRIYATDLDDGTDIEIDIGLNPAPGLTTADANIVADGLATFTAAGLTRLTLSPTVVSNAITAGVGLRTHEDLVSTLFATLIDNGDATSGTLYFQVEYVPQSGDVISDTVDNT